MQKDKPSFHDEPIEVSNGEKKIINHKIFHTGKYGRKLQRNRGNKFKRYYIGKIGKSPFAKMNYRQTRRSRSRRLKVDFQPRYNGAIYNYEKAVLMGLIKSRKKNKYLIG